MKVRGLLAGIKVLVVENEWIIADEICHVLTAEGAKIVGPTGCVDRALLLAKEYKIDAAVLDIHLGDDTDVYPIAKLLFKANVPFLFTTGYDSINIRDEFTKMPYLRKPFAPNIIGPVLNVVVTSSRQVQPFVSLS